MVRLNQFVLWEAQNGAMATLPSATTHCFGNWRLATRKLRAIILTNLTDLPEEHKFVALAINDPTGHNAIHNIRDIIFDLKTQRSYCNVLPQSLNKIRCNLAWNLAQQPEVFSVCHSIE